MSLITPTRTTSLWISELAGAANKVSNAPIAAHVQVRVSLFGDIVFPPLAVAARQHSIWIVVALVLSGVCRCPPWLTLNARKEFDRYPRPKPHSACTGPFRPRQSVAGSTV